MNAFSERCIKSISYPITTLSEWGEFVAPNTTITDTDRFIFSSNLNEDTSPFPASSPSSSSATSRCVEPLARRHHVDQNSSSSSPKLLVCHDMKNGYLNPGDANNFGSIYHTENSFHLFPFLNDIDIFCYFSHNLVTIPPSEWISHAHREGIKCIGTVITEWEQGKEICAKLFESKECTIRYANLLVDIAEYYGIDGWLINLENSLDHPDTQVPLVQLFLSHLTCKMKERVLEDAEVRNPINLWTGLDELTKEPINICICDYIARVLILYSLHLYHFILHSFYRFCGMML